MTLPSCVDMGRCMDIFNRLAGPWVERLAWAANVRRIGTVFIRYIGTFVVSVGGCFYFGVSVASCRPSGHP